MQHLNWALGRLVEKVKKKGNREQLIISCPFLPFFFLLSFSCPFFSFSFYLLPVPVLLHPHFLPFLRLCLLFFFLHFLSPFPVVCSILHCFRLLLLLQLHLFLLLLVLLCCCLFLSSVLFIFFMLLLFSFDNIHNSLNIIPYLLLYMCFMVTKH